MTRAAPTSALASIIPDKNNPRRAPRAAGQTAQRPKDSGDRRTALEQPRLGRASPSATTCLITGPGVSHEARSPPRLLGCVPTHRSLRVGRRACLLASASDCSSRRTALGQSRLGRTTPLGEDLRAHRPRRRPRGAFPSPTSPAARSLPSGRSSAGGIIVVWGLV